MTFAAGAVVAERYELISELDHIPARDGHLRVWQGRDTLLDRPIRVHLATDQVAQRLVAARTAAAVLHPMLVKILSVEESRDTAIIVTEDPGDLTLGEVHRAAPLDDMSARSLVGTLADALDEISRNGVYHQALDAFSVYLTPNGIKIAGLGIDAGGLAPEERTDQSRAHVDALSLLHLLYELLGEHAASDAAPDLPELPALTRRQNDAIMLALREPERAATSAREVSNLLAPWPAFTTPAYVTEHAAAKAPAAPEPAPSQPRRESVLGPGADRTASAIPGTPPAAPPQRRSVLGRPEPTPPSAWTELTGTPPSFTPGMAAGVAGSVASGVGAASQLASGVAAGVSGAGGAGVAAASGQYVTPQTARQTTQRGPTTSHAVAEPIKPLNLTPWIVSLFVLLTIFGLIWAFNYATTPKHHGAPGHSQASTGNQTGAGPTSGPQPSADPTSSATRPASALPVITAGTDLDPDGDGTEHPEAVALAFDGDPATYWYTEAYNDPTMGTKSGVGLALSFRQNSSFASITLNTNNTGGLVEVRVTTLDDPTGGRLLVSGVLAGTTTLDLPLPAQASGIVLWFPELPQNNDGRNRVELNEVTFS